MPHLLGEGLRDTGFIQIYNVLSLNHISKPFSMTGRVFRQLRKNGDAILIRQHESELVVREFSEDGTNQLFRIRIAVLCNRDGEAICQTRRNSDRLLDHHFIE